MTHLTERELWRAYGLTGYDEPAERAVPVRREESEHRVRRDGAAQERVPALRVADLRRVG